MKIISWDVGIKNLAYCILDENNNDINKPYNIYDWNIINLIENNYTCSENLNNCSNCKEKCLYRCNLNNKDYYFCKLHKILFNKFINSELNKIEEDLGGSCDYFIKKNNCNCLKKSKVKYCNKYY